MGYREINWFDMLEWFKRVVSDIEIGSGYPIYAVKRIDGSELKVDVISVLLGGEEECVYRTSVEIDVRSKLLDIYVSRSVFANGVKVSESFTSKSVSASMKGPSAFEEVMAAIDLFLDPLRRFIVWYQDYELANRLKSNVVTFVRERGSVIAILHFYIEPLQASLPLVAILSDGETLSLPPPRKSKSIKLVKAIVT